MVLEARRYGEGGKNDMTEKSRSDTNNSHTLESLYQHCQALLTTRQWPAALEAAVSLRARFAGNADPFDQILVARARLVHAQALVGLEQSEAALTIYEQLQAECSLGSDADLNAVGAEAQLLAAVLLAQRRRRLEGISKLEALSDHRFLGETLELRRIQSRAGAVLVGWQFSELETEPHSPSEELLPQDSLSSKSETPSAFERLISTCQAMLDRYGSLSDATVLFNVNLSIGVQLEALAWEGSQASQTQASALAALQWERYASHPDSHVQAKVLKTQLERTQGLAPSAERLLFERLLAQFGGSQAPALQGLLADTYLRQARALLVTEGLDDVLGRLTALQTRFAGSSDPEVQWQVILSRQLRVRVLRDLGRWRDALEVLQTQSEVADVSRADQRRAAAEAGDTQAKIWKQQLPPKLQSTDDSGDLAEQPLTEAELQHARVVRDLSQRFAADPEAAIRRIVSQALYNLGVDQRERRHLEDAVQTYQTYLDAFAEDEGVETGTTASVYLNLGYLLMMLLNREQEALSVYDSLMARFQNATSPAMRETLAKGAASRLTCLNRLQRAGKEVHYGSQYQDLPLTERDAITATIERGRVLGVEGKHREAVTLYDEVLTQYGQSLHPELRRQCSDALVRKAYSLSQLAQRQAALAVLETQIATYGAELSTSIQKDVALALSNKAWQLEKLGRHSEELETYEEILRRYGSSNLAYMRERVAKALYAKALTLMSEAVGDTEAGFAVYQDLIRRCLGDEVAVVRLQAAQALVNVGAKLRTLGRHAEAVEAYEKLLAACAAETDSGIRAECVKAKIGLARSNHRADQLQQRITIYRELLGLPDQDLSKEMRLSLRGELGQLEPTMNSIRNMVRSVWGRWWRKTP